MKGKIDLHLHTTCSDGVLSPQEVLVEAEKLGTSIISITDHDTIEAYTPELLMSAKEKGIMLIPAVEISTKTSVCGIHVLGYGIDLTNEKLQQELTSLRYARHDYLHKVAYKLEQMGYIVNTDELDTIPAVTKAHIALDIITNEKNKALLLETFHHLPSKGELIETLLNEGCPCYVEKKTMTPREAAILIRNAKGLVVLAHPVAYTYEDHLSDDDIMEIVTEMKADGLEANYIYIDRHNHKINDSNKWKQLARNHHLFTTIGSDFHKKDEVHPMIGLSEEEIELTEQEIEIILSKISSNLK